MLVHGAAGGVGVSAVQIAKALGARVLATAGSEEKRAFVRGLGADEAFDSRDPSWVNQVLKATLGKGADHIYDPVGGDIFDFIMKQEGVEFRQALTLLAESYPEVRVLALPENRFFSGGINAGIAAASGLVVAPLNNDTEADANWLYELKTALDDHPEAGMAASKLLLFDQRTILHSAGDFYRRNGIPGNRGV